MEKLAEIDSHFLSSNLNEQEIELKEAHIFAGFAWSFQFFILYLFLCRRVTMFVGLCCHFYRNSRSESEFTFLHESDQAAFN